jgi:hypothetical protein
MTEKLTLNKHQGQKITSFCRDYHRETKHEVVNEATLSGTAYSGGYSTDWSTEHQIIRCLGCETFSFRTVTGTEHDYVQVGEDEYQYQATVNVYPKPREGRQLIADVGLLPDKIQRIYEETLKSLNDTQPVLCGIGTRAIIETVCKDKSATGSDLYSKINSLVGLGVLTQDGADILHKLRTLGNDAAHEVKPHSLQELGLAFDVVDHLLLGVYILPEHAKKTFK